MSTTLPPPAATRPLLDPLSVVENALDEYREHLRTEFRARDPRLRQALDERLRDERFLSQEPFFQAHRPFLEGDTWDSLGLDPKLAQVMRKRTDSETAYRHQADALRRLMGAEPGPLVVTTGTGSGKTESFLLPVLQNAIEDAQRFKKEGLTAIIVYPMNALANDQEERIQQLLEASGHTYIEVARYDRQASEQQRAHWRAHPPRILLTNYVMLEYLLVRPADRDSLFANHRCRFLVLDEVHSYRGSLGSNIALLVRRLKAHLLEAKQDWNVSDSSDPHRFPDLIPIATSATIKSVDEQGRDKDEVRSLRDAAVRQFFGRVAGIADPKSILVVGEELKEIHYPTGARWARVPPAVTVGDDLAWMAEALAALGNGDASQPIAGLAARCAILWWLTEQLRRPQSVSQLAAELRTTPQRRSWSEKDVRSEIELALVVGSRLGADVPGALRLKVHRVIRGGWEFHRCVDPACGKLTARGGEKCECGRELAPLYLCRSCGTHTLRFRFASDSGSDQGGLLVPYGGRDNAGEYLLYEIEAAEELDDELDIDPDAASGSARPGKGLVGAEKQMKGKPVLQGSFDPITGQFAHDPTLYGQQVVLAPGRNRCLVCGSSAGAGSMLTPVALGTSAAVRVLGEGVVEELDRQHRNAGRPPQKERLLVFSDSRQDAAHQARFISYAGRYDRMRRNVLHVLDQAGGRLSLEKTIEQLTSHGLQSRDTPFSANLKDVRWVSADVRRRSQAWEEAPLLDDIAVSASFRASIVNVGLVGVDYEHLVDWCWSEGALLASQLGISLPQLLHLCRTLLDEVRTRGAISRDILTRHPGHAATPDEYRYWADWERRAPLPNGYASRDGEPVVNLADVEVIGGVRNNNWWQAGKGGSGTRTQRLFRRLLADFGGVDPSADLLLKVVAFLCDGPQLLLPVKLLGWQKGQTLLQVNAELVQLQALTEAERRCCERCHVRTPFAEVGMPCPNCGGELQVWTDESVDENRYGRRFRRERVIPLVAKEHTAQVPGSIRKTYEDGFKASAADDPTNVLCCSPTLEMGIDVGGLDAVVMRGIPPRPDNYAQRGGRAGRRERIGAVVSYARNTPHDGYFFDKPAEMIAGEVPAPGLALSNRDVVRRHLHAIAFGMAEPGLKRAMIEYVAHDGVVRQEVVDELLESLKATFPRVADLVTEAWEPAIREGSGLATPDAVLEALSELPPAVQNVFDRTAVQVQQLKQTVEIWAKLGIGQYAALNAMALVNRILGVPDGKSGSGQGDDRSAGSPMRRFAEFGILPGYEFPSEPCAVRLVGDAEEEEAITVERRFGLAQYEPEAVVHARGHRWSIFGLDVSSPWNPRSDEPSWIYAVCGACGLAYGAQDHSGCPRCGSTSVRTDDAGAYEYGGWLARRKDTPVLEEEDRFGIANRVRLHAQRDGQVVGVWRATSGWRMELRVRETIRWLNEGPAPTDAQLKSEAPRLHEKASGFLICGSCGKFLNPPAKGNGKGRSAPAQGAEAEDPFGHMKNCPHRGTPPAPKALSARGSATTLRIIVPVPDRTTDDEWARWGNSMGYALRNGMRLAYMLEGNELEFELEPLWTRSSGGKQVRMGALTFVDAAIGGSGILDRAAAEFHLVARATLEHLEHDGCESACYRCLKTYTNQRVHEHLSWPEVVDSLETLAMAPPALLAGPAEEAADFEAWRIAFEAGVGSPLEYKFLEVFHQNEIDVELQVPVSPDPDGEPISVADFRVKGTNVLIYVDGAKYHRGQRLRRDRFIRNRLREGSAGWTVIEVGAGHLADGKLSELIAQLQAVS